MSSLGTQFNNLRSAKYFDKITLIIVVIAVAALGTYLLSRSSAGTATASIEPGSTGSTVTAPAIVGSDTNASGGSYVQFNAAASTGGGGTTPGSWWKPSSSTPISWNWVIGNPPSTPYSAVNVYDIDGFDNSAATVQALHAQGSKVICYIDVGTYEPGRSDDSLIPAADQGSGVSGWPGEKWLNIADLSGLEPMIQDRMNICKSKGFDAIEPDNIDGYDQGKDDPSTPTSTTVTSGEQAAVGFPLTAAEQLTYDQYLATYAHSIGMSIGLKNNTFQTTQLQPYFDWALDEECNQYGECDTMAPFVNAGKAVFNAEYTSDKMTTTGGSTTNNNGGINGNFCPADVAAHINGVLFDLDLDGKTFQPCTGTW